MSQHLTMVELARAAADYIATTPAPEPFTANVHRHGQVIDIQPATEYGDSPGDILRSLLIWTHDLTEVTGRWWCPSPDRIHVGLTGHITPNIRAYVYDGIPADACPSWAGTPGTRPGPVARDIVAALAASLPTSPA